MLNSPISYSIYNLFTPEECDEIIQLGMQGRYDPGNIGDHSEHDVDKNIRDTELYFFNDQKIWSKIQPVIDAANRDNGWNFELAHSENFQLTVYNKDGHYNWHVDNHPTPYQDHGPLTGMVRKISFSVILNDDFEGGEFEFASPNPTEPTQIAEGLNKGSILIFPSYTAHKVNAVTKGQRYSLVCWICGYPWR